MNNNSRYKLIRSALELTAKEAARAVTLGGIETSANRARKWSASPGTTKIRRDGVENLYKAMTDEEFDAFCLGLKQMLDEQE